MAAAMKPVRIGNAQAFWGDRSDAAAEMLARDPDLDYLTLDYLAEVSMSILATQHERDPQAGFARDFVDVVRSLALYWASGGRCRLIANAGGLDPRACAEACSRALAEAGCRSLRIGVVTGDDVLETLREAAERSSKHFGNLDTGAAIGEVRDRLVTANAYLGAAPIVDALAKGADIVITGRVADPSLVVAVCVHHFGWTESQLDRLAGATVAGHLIECGTQVTGGISTDWLDVPDVAHIGFPIVEIDDDGSCVVTKPQRTGGRVTALTVKEQLLYEIGDPDCYISPDVAVSFLTLAIHDLGNDRVRVSGATGRQRPEMLKVSATYRDGFRSSGSLTMIGRDIDAKARRCGELVLLRVREAGFELRDSVIECLGRGGGVRGIVEIQQANDSRAFGETVLRVAVESESREAAERFSRELMPLITAGPQGTTGYTDGRPSIHPIFRYWPCLIARDQVTPRVEMVKSSSPSTSVAANAQRTNAHRTDVVQPLHDKQPNILVDSSRRPLRLYDIACARSGDKGFHANVGVIACSDEAWRFLQAWLTADRVAEFFSAAGVDSIERFELPNLQALNFILHGVLQQSLRTDAQGKALGQILLEMPLPDDAARLIPPRVAMEPK
jgi:hypothetical protein